MDTDRDPGDYDSTEVVPQIVNVWHPSFLPAPAPAPGGTITVSVGREYLKGITEQCRQLQTRPKAALQLRALNCWKDTPEPFKRLVARSAGLPADVVDKLDRDLTEAEKTAIRAAARRLKERADALFAL